MDFDKADKRWNRMCQKIEAWHEALELSPHSPDSFEDYIRIPLVEDANIDLTVNRFLGENEIESLVVQIHFADMQRDMDEDEAKHSRKYCARVRANLSKIGYKFKNFGDSSEKIRGITIMEKYFTNDQKIDVDFVLQEMVKVIIAI